MSRLDKWAGRCLRHGLLGFLALLPFAGTASAEPALWVAKSGDATFYLFGTVHLLKPDIEWRAPKIAAAFENSSSLWLELADGAPGVSQGNGQGKSQTAIDQAFLWKYGKDPAHPLYTKLSQSERQKLRAAAAKVGIAPVTFDSLRPWLAALTLTKAPLQQAGYAGEAGVDNQLLMQAKAANKKVFGLETVEQQMRFFADLPPEMELALLTQTIDSIDTAPDQLDQLAGAWLAGNVDALDTLLKDDGMGVSDKRLRKVLLSDRNAAWAERLAALAKEGGTHFIAVGAAHLAGADSLQALLRQRGFKVARL